MNAKREACELVVALGWESELHEDNYRETSTDALLEFIRILAVWTPLSERDEGFERREQVGYEAIRDASAELRRRVPPVHETDADCAPHLVDGVCGVCGVAHCGPCPSCAGRGFHNRGCAEIENPDRANSQQPTAKSREE